MLRLTGANSDGAQTGFQIAYDLTDGTKAYIRKQASGIWSEWRHFNTSEILSNLTTTNKSSLVDAINELNSNAIKYSNGTEIIINVTLKDNNVIIEFKDNGKGFDYYNTVYDRNKNSGFGLTMLKERVALLNGNIKYIYDNGSDFFIEIPVW